MRSPLEVLDKLLLALLGKLRIGGEFGGAEHSATLRRTKTERHDVRLSLADVQPALGQVILALRADFPIAAQRMAVHIDEAISGGIKADVPRHPLSRGGGNLELHSIPRRN